MMANCGKSKTKDNVEAEAARSMRECPANDLALAGVHAIIDQVGEGTTAGEQNARGDDDNDDEPGGGQRHSKQMQEALQTTAALWKRDQTPWDVANSFLLMACARRPLEWHKILVISWDALSLET